MTDGLQFSISGAEELNAKLDTVVDDVKRRGGRFALRKAAQVVRDAARANASRVDDPQTPENIAANIVERWNGRQFRRTGDLGFRVGVLGGARQTGGRQRRRGRNTLEGLGEIAGQGRMNPGGDTFYWRFVEFGTSRAPAQPFLRPALSQNVGTATDEFIREYGKALDRALRRAARNRS